MAAAPGPPYRPSYPLPETLTLSMGKESKRVDVGGDQEIQDLWQRITNTGAFNYAIYQLQSMHSSGRPPPPDIHYTLSHRISFYIDGDDKSYDLTSLGIPEGAPELRAINSACERIIALMKAKVSRRTDEVSPLPFRRDGMNHHTFSRESSPEMADLTGRVEQLEAALRFARDQELDAASRLRQVEAALTATTSENGVLREEFAANATRLREAQDGTRAAEGALAAAQADLDTSRRQNQQLSSELDRLGRSLEALQRTSDEAAAARDSATRELGTLRSTNDDLQRQLATSQALVAQLTAQIADQGAAHRTDLDQLQSQLGHANQTISDLSAQIAAQEGRISQLEGELVALRAIQDHHRAAQASVEALTARLRTSEENLEARVAEVAALRLEIEGSTATVAAQLQQIQQLTTRNRSLTAQLEANGAATAEIRAQLADQARTSAAVTQGLRDDLLGLGIRNSELQAAVDRNVAEISRLQGSLGTSEGENRALSARLAASEASLAAAQAAAEASAGSQRALQATLDALQAENQTLIGSLATSQASIRANESRIGLLNGEISELNNTNASLRSEIVANQRELDTIRGELAATTTRASEENAALQARALALVGDNQRLRESLEANTLTISSIRDDIAASQAENDRLRREAAASNALAEQGRARIAALEAELATSTSSREAAQGQVASLSSEVDGLRARVTELARAETQRDALAQELEALRSALVSNIRELEGMLGITSTTSADFDPQPRIAEIQRKISEGSALQRGQKALIESQIQDIFRMQSIIDERAAQIQRLIKDIKATRVSNREKDEAIARLTSQNADLLGQLEASLATISHLEATLQEQLRTSDAANQSYERQIETLRQRNTELHQAIADNRGEMAALQESLGASQRDNADLRERLATLEASLRGAQGEAAASAARAEALATEIAGLQAENRALSESSTASQATIRGNQERIGALEADLARTSARTVALERQISALTDTNAALSQRIHQLEGVEAELQALTDSNAELRRNYDRLRNDLARLTADQGTALTALESMLGISPTPSHSDPATRIDAIQGQITAREGALVTLTTQAKELAGAVVAGEALIQSKLAELRKAEGTIASQKARIASLESGAATLIEENYSLATRLAALDRTEETNRTLLADNAKLQLQLSAMQASLGHFAAAQEDKLSEFERALDIINESSSTSTRAANISRALAAKSKALDETRSHLETQAQEIAFLREQLVTQADTHRGEIAKTQHEINAQSETIGRLSAELSLQGGVNRVLRDEIESIKRARDSAIKKNSLLTSAMRELSTKFKEFIEQATRDEEEYVKRIHEAEGNVARIVDLQDKLQKSTALNLSLQGSLTALQGIAAAKEAGDARLEEEAKIKSDLEERLREHERILRGCYESVWHTNHIESELPDRINITNLPKLIHDALDYAWGERFEITRLLQETRARNADLLSKHTDQQVLQKEIRKLQQELERSGARNADLEATLLALDARNQELADYLREVAEGAEEFAAILRHREEKLAAQLKFVTLRCESLLSEKEQIIAEVKRLQQIADAKGAAEALCAETQAELATVKTESKAKLAEITATLSALEALDYPERVRELKAAESHLMAQLSIKETEVAKLRGELTIAKDANRDLTQTNRDLQARLKQSEREIRKIRQDMAQLLSAFKSLTGRVDYLSEENSEQAHLINLQAAQILYLETKLAERDEIMAAGTLTPAEPAGAGSGAGAGVVEEEIDALSEFTAEIESLEQVAREIIPAEAPAAKEDFEFPDAKTYQNFIIQRALISSRIKYMPGKGNISLFYIPKSIFKLDMEEFNKFKCRDPSELERAKWRLNSADTGKVIEIGEHTLSRGGKKMEYLANRLCLIYLADMHRELHVYRDLQQAVNLKTGIKLFTGKIRKLTGQASTKKFIDNLKFHSSYFWKDLVVYKMIFSRLPTLAQVAVPLENICKAFSPAISKIRPKLKITDLGGAGGPSSPAHRRQSGGPGGGTPGSRRK